MVVAGCTTNFPYLELSGLKNLTALVIQKFNKSKIK
jgi:hypothetical protein